MIKILFFIPVLSEGGAEKVLRNLVNNMDQTKFDITVQTINEFDPKKYLADGIHYKSINRCKTNIGKRLFDYYFRLCAQLKIAYSLFVKDSYDIEVAYLETGAPKIIAQSTNKTAKKIAWVHCDLSKNAGMQSSVNKTKEYYGHFDRIVCVSNDARDGFHKMYGDDFNTMVVQNVVDEEEIYEKMNQKISWEKKADTVELLAVGRLTPQKNFEYLIRTCRKIKDDGIKMHLVILGEGFEREKLEKLISDLHLEDTVSLYGFVSNPYPWMKQADIIVCSSIYEGMSTVIQEAMIIGKPVVTTPCSGMKEILGDSEYGLICEDTEDGLYEGLVKMIKSPEERDKYERMSKVRGELLKKKNSVKMTEDLFYEMAKK